MSLCGPNLLTSRRYSVSDAEQPVLFSTINGTGVPGPFDDGPTSFPGQAGWAVSSPWIGILAQCGGPQWQQNVTWLPVGYAAAVQNMNASVIGGAQAWLQTQQTGGGIHDGPWPIGTKQALFGYSQGAMVANYIAREYWLNPNGPMHDRYLNGDLAFVFNVGDPNRTPGLALGNELAGIAQPKTLDGSITGGISGLGDPSKNVLGVLTPAETLALNVISLALDGDLYAAAPMGPMYGNPPAGAVLLNQPAAAGAVGTSIFNMIQTTTITSVIKIVLDLGHPIGAAEEILNGMVFAAAAMNAPHFLYGPFVYLVVQLLQQVVAGQAVGWKAA